MVEGDLSGMFDGVTTARIDLDARLVVLDLSAVFASPALPLLMTCATAWLQAILTGGGGTKRLVVVDEAWAILHNLATARLAAGGLQAVPGFRRVQRGGGAPTVRFAGGRG